MKEIIIRFQPFIFKQNVYIRDLQTDKLELEQVASKDLAKYIATKSVAENCNKVLLFGNKSFANKIKEECMTKYNLNPKTTISIL